MAPLRTLLVAALSTTSLDATSAFTSPSLFGAPTRITTRTHNTRPLFGLAQPSVEIGQKTAVGTKVDSKTSTTSKQKISTAPPKARREQKFEEPILYKVMLIGDEDYDSAHITERLCAVMEDMDESQAVIVFKGAMSAGKAMCGKYPLEHAEMYVEQLLRSDPIIYSELEEEDKI
mmetsp:Transcript_13097/g.18906  ORF Transcript_13097/g.18906 Transcript_13097/m.18906 type:complete len:175 (-) Transcript_13097:256-780(-)|eukprot:CAMPEP_0195518806 /NCGR_PEP_ID=MMETSP0794_2-20130614/13699_1 /TAXON_ID=515487 /ORGANISM="Stephanopyxis turris, Strain CCMP 815" /LENGTH=174 /DNA_ID=CAMNT_0040647833 /DNA_START=78 /DNA_END=602 /DNA_ORIENTATION=+